MECNIVNREMPINPCNFLAGQLNILQLSIDSATKIYLSYSASNVIMYHLKNSIGNWMQVTLPKGKYKMQLNGSVRGEKSVNTRTFFAFYRLDGSILTQFPESYRAMTHLDSEKIQVLTMESDIFDVAGSTTVQLWGATSGTLNEAYLEFDLIWNIYKID